MRGLLTALVCIFTVTVPSGEVLALDIFGKAQKYILGDSEGDVRQPYLKDGKIPQNEHPELDITSNTGENGTSGVFYLVIDQSDGKRLLGLYTKNGLQLQ